MAGLKESHIYLNNTKCIICFKLTYSHSKFSQMLTCCLDIGMRNVVLVVTWKGNNTEFSAQVEL